MKFANVGGRKTHIKDARRGDIGIDYWSGLMVFAKKGPFLKYWRYVDGAPMLPKGYEDESEWHAAWKESIIEDNQEVVLGDNNEHRADIYTGKYVIELQKSSIKLDLVQDRNIFYSKYTSERLVWVVNCYRVFAGGGLRIGEKVGKNVYKLVWRRSKKWAVAISGEPNNDVFLDLSPKTSYLLKIWKYNEELFCSIYKKSRFYDHYLAEVGKGEDEFLKRISSINIEKNY